MNIDLILVHQVWCISICKTDRRTGGQCAIRNAAYWMESSRPHNNWQVSRGPIAHVESGVARNARLQSWGRRQAVRFQLPCPFLLDIFLYF